MKKCPKCNLMIENDSAKFCKKCGTNIENEPIIMTEKSDEVIESDPEEEIITIVENDNIQDQAQPQPQR